MGFESMSPPDDVCLFTEVHPMETPGSGSICCTINNLVHLLIYQLSYRLGAAPCMNEYQRADWRLRKACCGLSIHPIKNT